MDGRKYPAGLLIAGFVMNVFLRFSWLLIPGIVLLIAGIFVRTCAYIGLALVLLDVLLSLLTQLRYRSVTLRESDDPEFRKFQEALSKDGNWRNNIQEMVDEKIREPHRSQKP